jgi:hypothetical protein
LKKGSNSTSGEYFRFYQHILKYNADAAKKLLKHFNEVADAGNCEVCMWILELWFLEDYDRCEYCKMNVVSENKKNIEIIV